MEKETTDKKSYSSPETWQKADEFLQEEDGGMKLCGNFENPSNNIYFAGNYCIINTGLSEPA